MTDADKRPWASLVLKRMIKRHRTAKGLSIKQAAATANCSEESIRLAENVSSSNLGLSRISMLGGAYCADSPEDLRDLYVVGRMAAATPGRRIAFDTVIEKLDEAAKLAKKVERLEEQLELALDDQDEQDD